MKIRYILVCSLIIILFAVAASGEWRVRPVTGRGVLIIRSFNPDTSNAPPVLIFYQEPGVGRICERSVSSVPLLSSFISLPAGEFPVASMGKKGEWLLIVYDDAGREGWVRLARWWDYENWDAYLKGRTVYLLPGLGKERYSLFTDPSMSSAPTSTVAADLPLSVLEANGDWLRVAPSAGPAGWISWRDGDGRFLVTIGERIVPQKH
jgi:hypothetical protein